MKRTNPFYEEALAVASGTAEDRPVTISRFRHTDLVDGLHELVHRDPSMHFPRDRIRIGHGDGTESAPFPLPALGSSTAVPHAAVDRRALEPAEHREVPFPVGFISGRHPEMDRDVSFYLARHGELELRESSAEKEEDVFGRTLDLFEDPAMGDVLVVEAYHTGLELFTVAFYRAVVELAARGERGPWSGTAVVPKIWGGARVNLSTFAGQHAEVLDEGALVDSVRREADALSAFLAVEEDDVSDAVYLRWRAGRPMFESERHLLHRRAERLSPVFHLLYRLAQYRTARAWRIP